MQLKYIKYKYKLCLAKIVMAYIRTKNVRGKNYYYLVEGSRDQNGKVKQKVIRYLGNVESILEKFEFWDKRH